MSGMVARGSKRNGQALIGRSRYIIDADGNRIPISGFKACLAVGNDSVVKSSALRGKLETKHRAELKKIVGRDDRLPDRKGSGPRSKSNRSAAERCWGIRPRGLQSTAAA